MPVPRHKPGRPRVAQPRTHTLSFSMTERQGKALRRAARKAGRSVSSLVLESLKAAAFCLPTAPTDQLSRPLRIEKDHDRYRDILFLLSCRRVFPRAQRSS